VPSGFDKFDNVLKSFGKLSVWALGAGSAPFVGALASLAPPPWSKQITGITAVLDLVVLVLVFQFFVSASRKQVNRTMILMALVLALALFAYLFAFNRYTFVVPASGGREVKGFVCTKNAELVYGKDCQDNAEEILASMEYKAERLWEKWSIDRMTLILAALWLLFFGALSAVLGLFIVYQQGQPADDTTPDRVATNH
jgi:hypothetical protein